MLAHHRIAKGLLIIALLLANGMAYGEIEVKPLPDLRPDYLFVMLAKQAEIKKQGDSYKLILKQTQVNHVLQFSDKPFRIANYMRGQQLTEFQPQAKQDLRAYPPNAAIIINEQLQAVQLLDMSYVDGTMEFTLAEDSMPIKPMLGTNAAVFVDSWDLFGGGGL
jgi:hypothetical protein